MGYRVAAASTNNIACGTTVATAATYSWAIRLATLADNVTTRKFFQLTDLVGNTTCYVELAGNQLNFGFGKTGGTVFPTVVWNPHAFSFGVPLVVVGTYDGANLRVYAGTDATAKATLAETGTPDTGGTQTWIIGNALSGGTESAASTIYELGWWPGVVLTGAQAAILGNGGRVPVAAVPLPANYWPLLSDARDLFGSAHGTVTGATLVVHAGTNWFPPAAAPRFTVGTKTEIISAATLVASFEPDWFWQDSGIGILNNGDATYTFVASVGGSGQTGAPSKTVGTPDNPFSVSAVLATVTGTQDAPDATAAQITYQGGGPIYKDPASGMWLIFSHQERQLAGFPATQYYSWLGILKSTDAGATWVDCGAIITPRASYAEMAALYASFGKSDGSQYKAEIQYGPYLIVGDYFYVYYFNVDGPIVADDPNTGGGVMGDGGYCVARALVADVVAAAATGTVGVWNKYNAGTWTELGIRGTGTRVTDQWAFGSAFSFNTVRNRYIVVNSYGTLPAPDDDKQTIFYSESTDGLAWTTPELLATASATGHFTHAYHTLLDPTSPVPYLTGQAFYLIGKDVAGNSVDRWLITLDAEGPTDMLHTTLHHAYADRGD